MEYDPETAKLLKKTYEEVGTELFELNSAIESIKEPKIKREAIAVRERIMDLYNDGTDYKYLVGLITNTTKLLICTEPNKMKTTINDYETVVSNFRIEETLYTAMLSLLSSIVKAFTGKHTLDKEMAYKESASSLLASSFGQFMKPKHDTHRFLKNVDASNINRVSQKLEKNIALLVQKGEVTDSSGRTFSNISGFQYAILTGRVQALEAMLDSLPDGREGESLKKVLKNQYEELKENGASCIEFKDSGKSITHCKLEENQEINLLISLVLNTNLDSGNNLIR